MLRAVYCGFTAPVQVMLPEEALLVKYASNVFHALKVAFANEIGVLCQSSGIDGRAVMSAFCRDTRLNISSNYLMPGFAFGGSCLPKDVRAVMYLAKQADVDLPLINSLFSSNARVVDRAIRQVINSRAVRIGLIGLSFKSSTDDLRESPYVEIAERLLGKGYQLKVYDPNVSMAQLTGSNKAYIEQAIPHLSRLLVATPDELTDSDLLVAGHSYREAEAFLAETEIPVLDLTGRRSSRALDVEELCGLSAAF
jgi:GDP-mannose 6-dehydrogenase